MRQPDKLHEDATQALVALGANIRSAVGAPEATVRAALRQLRDLAADGIVESRLYRTPCFPPGAGPDYVNAAARLSTTLDPAAFLDELHVLEADQGRVRRQRWGARTLDLDVIDHAGRVVPDMATYAAWRDLAPERQRAAVPDRLILPHPRIAERAFVLVPLAEVAPDWRHPVSGLSAQAMLDALPEEEKAGIRAL